jgi:hypothetical protein
LYGGGKIGGDAHTIKGFGLASVLQVEQCIAVRGNILKCGDAGLKVRKVAEWSTPVILLAAFRPLADDLNEAIRIPVRQGRKKHAAHGAEDGSADCEPGDEYQNHGDGESGCIADLSKNLAQINAKGFDRNDSGTTGCHTSFRQIGRVAMHTK